MDPMERMTVSELMDHPWLQENRSSNIELSSPAIMLDKVQLSINFMKCFTHVPNITLDTQRTFKMGY